MKITSIARFWFVPASLALLLTVTLDYSWFIERFIVGTSRTLAMDFNLKWQHKTRRIENDQNEIRL